MIVTRYWTDAAGAPHAEVSEWRAVDSGSPLSVGGGAALSDAVDPGTPVTIVSLSAPAVDLAGATPGDDYLTLPLRAGATLIDQPTYQTLGLAALAEAVPIEEQIAEYLAAQVPDAVNTMLDKLVAAAGLDADERAALAARLN